jgi:uncharacterized protein
LAAALWEGMLAPIISDPAFYAVAIPAVIFLGLAKGGFSGVATGATPLLALYLPPLEAAALLLPIVLCQDVISVHAYWREWSGWILKILLPGALFGLILGYLFAAHVSDDTIRILIGITALIFVANTWLRPTHPKPTQSGVVAGLFWGTVAGFLSFASQGGGPPFQVFTLPQRLSKMTFVGTTAIFFAALNVIKIVPYALLAVVANMVGIWLIKVVPTAQFFRITYVLLFVLGSVLFYQSATHMLHEMNMFELTQTIRHA